MNERRVGQPPCDCDRGLGATATTSPIVTFLRGDSLGSLLVFGFAGVVLWKILK